MVRLVLALSLVLAFVSSAAADLSPPPPAKGFKQVRYENVVRLATEIPDYQFFPFERLGINGKEKIGSQLKFDGKKDVPVASSSSASVRTGVVAVPKTLMEQLQSTEKLAELLYRENEDKLPAGVVVHETYGSVMDIPKNDPRKKVINVITVSRDEKAGVRFTAAVAPAPTDSSGDFSPQKPWRTLAAGVFIACAFASIGIRYLRRRTAE